MTAWDRLPGWYQRDLESASRIAAKQAAVRFLASGGRGDADVEALRQFVRNERRIPAPYVRRAPNDSQLRCLEGQ